MGKKERLKGKAVELKLVKAFKEKLFKAQRVPFSGAGREKGDVSVEKPDSRYGEEHFEASFWYYEVKSRKDLFDTIYKLYESFCNGEDSVLEVKLGRQTCFLSYNFQLLRPIASEVKPTHTLDLEKSAFSSIHPAMRVFKFKKWLGKCSALVLKGDYKAFLFVNYADTYTSDDSRQDLPD